MTAIPPTERAGNAALALVDSRRYRHWGGRTLHDCAGYLPLRLMPSARSDLHVKHVLNAHHDLRLRVGRFEREDRTRREGSATAVKGGRRPKLSVRSSNA